MGGNHKEMYAFETRRLMVDGREEFLAHVKIDYPGATIDDVPVWICAGPSGSTVGYGQTVKQAQRDFYGLRFVPRKGGNH